jgi:hypothetical protein
MKRILAVLVAVLIGTTRASAQGTVNLVPGDLTYQFADPLTGLPLTNLVFNGPQAQRVDVYLLQTGGNIQYTDSNTHQTVAATDIFQQIGIESLGVRLIYSSPSGVVRVPGGSAAIVNVSIQPNPNFDVIQKGGSTADPPSGPAANNTADTSTNAALTDGIYSIPSPAFPGPEDPYANPLRILIGSFRITPIGAGSVGIQAVDPFSVGNQNLTGPIPPDNVGESPLGEVWLDQYLGQYAASPTIPSLMVTVVPEPGTLALAGTAAGLLAWRGRRKVTPLPALRERDRE